jgi:hypothetical protein
MECGVPEGMECQAEGKAQGGGKKMAKGMDTLDGKPASVGRREFCRTLAAAAVVAEFPAWGGQVASRKGEDYRLVADTDRRRIFAAASSYLKLPILTITSFPSERSPGGLHDYFSQADYFWPDPKNPDGPYVNRDGQSNPDNFNGHRKAMIALSIQMPALTAAWVLTGDRIYGQRAADHLRAWFLTPATRMNPSLEFAQGVHGASKGRSYGIIDTLHLVEVARAAGFVAPVMLSGEESAGLKDWFRSYLEWIKSSDNGKKERDALNNHATCWALQASEFARLIEDSETREQVYSEYTTVLLPNQLAANGSFPQELERTKPYGYSIFNFDVMATLCQSLKGVGSNAFSLQLPDGGGICKAAEFLYPYLKDKSAWPYRKDLEHFDSWPVRSPGLLFTGLACRRPAYLDLWKTLNPDPTDAEIIRNYPIRQPLLWVG